MFYEPRIQEPEPFVPKIWQDFGHVPRHEWARPLSTILSQSREQSSGQRTSSVSEVPSIPADASASYLDLITPKARPFAVLERFLGKGEQPKPEARSRPEVLSKPEVRPEPVPEPKILPCLESPSQLEGDSPPGPPEAEHKLASNHETEHLTAHLADKASSKDVTKSDNQNPDQPSSPSNPDNDPQSLKSASVTAEDLIGIELPYHLLFAANNSPPETRNPTSTKLPILPPPPSPPLSPPPSLPSSLPSSPPQSVPQQLPPSAETRPLEIDDAFLSRHVPTKYLPVNEQLPNKLSWRDVLDLAQSVLSDSVEEVRPVVRSKVNLLAASSVDEDPDADRHSLLTETHVPEVEGVVDEDDDDETGSVVRSSFSSFDIRDVNFSLHKEVSKARSWREKWRGRKRVSGNEGA